nr:hypothetical protein BaRGS_011485 [Batillaria attramentaria]
MTNETFKEGDHYKEVNCYADGRMEEFVFKLDEPFTTNVMGMEAKNVFKLDGEAVKGKHEVFGLVTTTVKYLKDGLGVFVSVLS